MYVNRAIFIALLTIGTACSDGDAQSQNQPAVPVPVMIENQAAVPVPVMVENQVAAPVLLTFFEVMEKINSLSYFSDSTFTLFAGEKAEIVCRSDELRSWLSEQFKAMSMAPDSPFMTDSQANDWIDKLISPWLDSAKSAQMNGIHKGCSYSLLDKTGEKLRIHMDVGFSIEDFFFQCDADSLKAIATIRANRLIATATRPLDLLIRDQEIVVTAETKLHLGYLFAFGDSYEPNLPDYVRNANCKPNKSMRAIKSKSLIKKN